MIKKLIFKQEGINKRGVVIGPLWKEDENGKGSNFKDGESMGDGKFYARWYTIIEARRFARQAGVELEE